MSSRDFLHQDVETNLCELYVAAGAVFTFFTNSERLLEAARQTFRLAGKSSTRVDFSVRLWVDDVKPELPPWPKPYVRGLNHLVFAGFSEASSMLADLQTHRVIGRFSPNMATDSKYWRMVVFPVLLSVLAGSLGIVELHASCVATLRRGMVLIGSSGSGKSTLAMAMTEQGSRLLSDDRTFCSLKGGKLLAWGIPRPLKLRREAALWFEGFRGREPLDVQNGEYVFHWERPLKLDGEDSHECEPRLLVFLERHQHPGFDMSLINRAEARSRIEQDLLAEAPDAVLKQAETIDRLLTLPCRRLRFGGRPQSVAQQLLRYR
jgi:hypothetical protein